MDINLSLPWQCWHLELENRESWLMVSWPRNICKSCESRGYKQNWVTHSRECSFLWCPWQNAEVCITFHAKLCLLSLSVPPVLNIDSSSSFQFQATRNLFGNINHRQQIVHFDDDDLFCYLHFPISIIHWECDSLQKGAISLVLVFWLVPYFLAHLYRF